MSQALQISLDLLDLEQIEEDIFRGRSRSAVVPRVFGGQVAAQALVAAGRTVPEDRPPTPCTRTSCARATPARRSSTPVDRIRDGRSFTTRRVVAVQHGQPIFHLSASFQEHEEGLEHQAPDAARPRPGDAPHRPRNCCPRYATGSPTRASSSGSWRRARPSTCATSTTRRTAPSGEPREPHSQVWFRTNGKLADDPLLHVCLATYVSDMTLLDSVLLAHGRGGWAVGDVVGACLDHAMWFHRPFRADEWLLYDQESPSASGGRGLGQARIYTQDGRLAISVIQEGVVRVPRAP